MSVQTQRIAKALGHTRQDYNILSSLQFSSFHNLIVGLHNWKSLWYSGGYRFQYAMQIKSKFM